MSRSSLSVGLTRLCPHQESNLDRRYRKPAFYPLNYEGVARIITQIDVISKPRRNLLSVGIKTQKILVYGVRLVLKVVHQGVESV